MGNPKRRSLYRGAGTRNRTFPFFAIAHACRMQYDLNKQNNGRGEYDNNLFRSILRISGISFEPSPPYAQHKNGVSERIIGAITEKARAMMIDCQAPVEFWGEAIMTATYLHRRVPHKALN